MLVVPESFRNFTWIGIDPGLSQCGIAIFKAIDNVLSSIQPFTIVTNQIKMFTGLPQEYQLDRSIRMNKLCSEFRNILYNETPMLVCCESPFFNPTMPSAFGSLTETVTALRLELCAYSPFIPFVTYAPQEVKQTFKRSGQIGKVVMKEALMADPFLCSKLLSHPELLDEHAVDATAVGYTWYVRQVTGSV